MKQRTQQKPWQFQIANSLKRNSRMFTVIVAFGMVFNSSAQMPVVYSANDFAGSQLELTKASYSVDDLRATIGNDNIQSIKVPAGYEVTLFEHNFSGRKVTAWKNEPNMVEFGSQAVSSIAVMNTWYPTVYSEGNYEGERMLLTESEYTVADLRASIGNDNILSIQVPEGYEVTLYEHEFSGVELTVTTSALNLIEIEPVAVSSIRIVKKGGSEVKCEGRTFKVDTYKRIWENSNDEWTYIGENCNVLACARRRVFNYTEFGPLLRYNETPESWTLANTLKVGEFLNAGTQWGGAHYLASQNNGFYFYMQEDGNLGTWTTSHPAENTYASLTAPQEDCTLKMQEDGNLAIYNVANDLVWSTETTRAADPKYDDAQFKPVKLVLENDGRVVLYSETGFKVWDNVNGKYPLN